MKVGPNLIPEVASLLRSEEEFESESSNYADDDGDDDGDDGGDDDDDSITEVYGLYDYGFTASAAPISRSVPNLTPEVDSLLLLRNSEEEFEGGPVNEPKYGNCPEGQNWISGSIKRYGYCSPSTVTEIITQSSPVASPSPSKNIRVCPSGQNWISGTNPKYGYCSPSAISDVLPSFSASAAVLPKEKASSKVALAPDSCPEGQNWITGTNSNYGYCSTSSVSSLLNDPSRSSITAINPVDVRGASTYR